MNILIGKNSGFCAGVKYTITRAEEELAKNPQGIDCLGEIIHNKQVIDSLEKKGLRTINSIEEAKNKVLIRAHGIAKEVYDYANKHNIELIDLTCPNVLQIHKQIDEFSKNNYFILLFGVKNHPETIGNYSFCGYNSFLLDSIDDIPLALDKVKNSNLNDVLIISQTTFSVSLFEEMSASIINRFR